MNGGLPVDTLGESQGFARITSRGIDVIEGNATSPFAINIVHSSSNVQIGEGNAQSFTFSGEKIVGAINNSNATTTEQEKAKSLWQSVLDRLTKVIGLFTGA
jgi:ABC-type transport system substrate-binding protein